MNPFELKEAQHVTDYINSRERFRNAKVRAIATHKFAVGAHVVHQASVRSGRESFKVTRHLPDGGQGLQYRIRADRDGQERVVVESALERAT
ncbi:hypothetical protein LG047_01395 [Methylocystis sp. WRRC1]|uniref:hypothetical protein n=1 Tax=Methylocystis sp. WRRC1 TaxID=1732014 RepID=UPI001D14B981|nr:hypothetical protein [Methylocystis sp. WRRC1]MCC3243984.1 hypothetical protein [Methylocystis sp. WRRC1]